MSVRSLVRSSLGCVLLSASLAGQSPNYVLSLGSSSGAVGVTASVVSTIDNDGSGYISAWSLGVCSDPAVVTPIAIDLADTATMVGGAPPAFYNDQIFAGGWTQGVVINFGLSRWLAPGTQGFVNAIAEYEVAPSAPIGTVDLEHCSTLGSPPWATVVVVGGASIAPTLVSGWIEIGPPLPQFIRGDADADGSVDFGDVFWLLGELFLASAPVIDCALADDVNGDGLRDIADAIYLLNYHFAGGPSPSAPFPVCGVKPGTELPDCAESDCP